MVENGPCLPRRGWYLLVVESGPFFESLLIKADCPHVANLAGFQLRHRDKARGCSPKMFTA